MPAEVQARCGVLLGREMPEPLVDLAAATRAAKARVYALRAKPAVREAKATIVEKHGSRRQPNAQRVRDCPGSTPRQSCLDL